MGKYTVLIIDDEPQILQALERVFRSNYEVLTTASAKEGLSILKSHENIQLIICDQRMPDMTGVAFFEASLQTSPHSMRILLTGYSDIESVIDAVNKGQVYKYLTKPWETPQLKLEVKKALEVYELEKTVHSQNKKLMVLDKAKNDFLMLISHELRTPLTTILSFTHFLQDGGTVDKEQREHFIDRIQEGGQKLQEIIDDTLDLITAQMGKLKVKKTHVAIERVIKEAQTAVHEMALKKKITLYQFEGSPLESKIDIPLMKKAFEKLIQFAIYASDEQGKITMSIETDEDIHINLNYKGQTLTAEQQSKIFKPFLVVGDILNHKLGAGLSLPVCKTIIAAHQGSISVTSSKEHGTTFTINLPK